MSFNGRFLQEALDKRMLELTREIYVLRDKLDLIQKWRQIIDLYTFYECDKGHGVYGIRLPDPIKCKMCKRLEA